jgi:hypothetical protein
VWCAILDSICDVGFIMNFVPLLQFWKTFRELFARVL